MRARSLRLCIAAAMAALVVGLFATAAEAQGDEDETSSGDVIRFGIIVVQGVAYKPNAFFINTRRALVYETLELRESFVSEITEPLEDKDF